MLHIHNGESVLTVARRANLPGEHTAFRDTLVVGPIPPSDWIETRARFLSESYGEKLLRVRNELLQQQRVIDAAAGHDEVVLWFEHDLFCLVNFLYLLAKLAAHRRLTAVWSEQPIGGRDEGELELLFESRRAVTPHMLAAAQRGWTAYAAPDPLSLNLLLAEESDLPFLRSGLALHAARFPSTRNGLGSIESRSLEIVANGANDFAKIFDLFNTDEPRYGLGDAQLYRILWSLANVATPMLAMTKRESDTATKALFALTPAGERVLANEADYLDLNGTDFWLGGAHLTNGKVWRWDGRTIVV